MAQIRNIVIDPVPQVVIDGKTIKLAEPFKWYEWIWILWSMAELYRAGAIGSSLGAIAIVLNGRIFRFKMNHWGKYFVTGIISITAIFSYFLFATIVNQMIKNK